MEDRCRVSSDGIVLWTGGIPFYVTFIGDAIFCVAAEKYFVNNILTQNHVDALYDICEVKNKLE